MINRLLVGSAALVVWGSVNPNGINQSALDDWWTNEHLPERLSIPGFLRARRYFNQVQNKANYLTLYETESLDTLTSDAYMDKLNNPTPGTQNHLPTLATMQRSACEVTQSEIRNDLRACRHIVGGALSMIVVSSKSDHIRSTTLQGVASHLFRTLSKERKDLMGCHILREDLEATKPGSSSQSYLNGNLQSSRDDTSDTFVVLLEHSSPARPAIVTDGTPAQDIVNEIKEEFGTSLDISAQGYNFMCCVSQ